MGRFVSCKPKGEKTSQKTDTASTQAFQQNLWNLIRNNLITTIFWHARAAENSKDNSKRAGNTLSPITSLAGNQMATNRSLKETGKKLRGEKQIGPMWRLVRRTFITAQSGERVIRSLIEDIQ